MTTLPHTAQQARQLVREQHAAEVAGLRRRIRNWRRTAAFETALVVLLGGVGVTMVLRCDEPSWRGVPDAPPLQRVQAITDAYLDKDGKWRSFDNGEVITAYLWKP